MKPIDQIIHARWVLPCESAEVLENYALVIHAGKILDLLPSDQATQTYSAATTETFASHVLMPGFVNTHTHIGMNLFRGLADDLGLMDWLNNHIWPAERAFLSEEFVYAGSCLAAAEMIRSGTTCFNESYFYPGATARAADRAGLRANVGIFVIDFATPWAKDPKDYLAKGFAAMEPYLNHDRIRATIAPHAPYSVAEAALIEIQDLATQHDLKIHMHVHETATEVKDGLAKTGKRPLQRLHELGLLTPRLIAIHMTQIDAGDLELLIQTKPSIVHCAESNMKLASGTCPVTELQKAGLNVALGTDGVASNNDLDMIGEMRTAAFLAKHQNQDPTALSAHEILQMATLNGAKAVGIDQVTGSLVKGKAADFIAINFDAIETQPLYHPASQIVYAASRNQVTDVWVGGKRLMKKRELLTLDEKELKATAKSWQQKIKVNGL